MHCLRKRVRFTNLICTREGKPSFPVKSCGARDEPQACFGCDLIAARPLVAFAQKDDPVDHVPKLSIQDAQKVAQTISNDKIKLQAYCEIGKLQEELEKAEEKNETKAIEHSAQRLTTSDSKSVQSTQGSWMG